MKSGLKAVAYWIAQKKSSLHLLLAAATQGFWFGEEHRQAKGYHAPSGIVRKKQTPEMNFDRIWKII